MTAEFTATAPDIQCDACANAIKRSLGRLPGISRIDVAVDTKAIRVEYDPAAVTEPELREQLGKAGFPTG